MISKVAGYFCLSIIIVIILTYNLKIAFQEKYNAGGDDLDYIYLATAVAKTGIYGYMDRNHHDVIEDYKKGIVGKQTYKNKNYASWRAPLWPATMASILYIFGYNLDYIILFKLIIHLISGFLIYKSFRLLKLTDTLSLIGSFIFIVSPVYQIYSRVFYAEPLTSFFFSLFVFSIIYYIEKRKLVFLIPLFAGCLVLTHPYYLFFPFAVYGVLWLNKFIFFKQLLIFSVASFFIISIWPIRNSIVLETNSYVITTSSGPVMAKGWNQNVVEKHTNTKGDLANEGLVFEGYQSDKSFRGGAANSQRYQDAVFQFIEKNPNKILPIILKKLKSAFNPFQETLKGGILEAGREFFQALSLICLLLLFFTNDNILKSLGISLVFSTIAITIVTYSGFRFRAPQFYLELLIILYVYQRLYSISNLDHYKNN